MTRFRSSGQQLQRIPSTGKFLIGKEKQFVFDDGKTYTETRLIIIKIIIHFTKCPNPILAC
ncbi:hypothetical protein D3C85_975680 [compost metagenome]